MNPVTRIETYLAKMGGQDVQIPDAPNTKLEVYLTKLCGVDVELPEQPDTRFEVYLRRLCEVSAEDSLFESNTLLSSLDANGNRCPWKENTRWSDSAGVEANAEGIYLSGYIPCVKGQTVYLKNVNLPNVNGSGVIHWFSDLGTRMGGSHITDVVTYWNGLVDENNIVEQFTLPPYDTYADVKYLRIECIGFDDTSVVTVKDE